MDLRTDLGRLQHDRVAAGHRHGDGPHAQDHGGVPGGDAEHHADRLADREGRHAGLIRGDDLAGDLRGQGRGVPQHLGAEFDVEPRPMRRRADLLDHGRREVRHSCFEQGRGPHQTGPAGARSASRPGRERPRGRQSGVGGVLNGRGRGPAGERSGDRIAPLETDVVRRGPVLVLHEERHIEQRDLPDRHSFTRPDWRVRGAPGRAGGPLDHPSCSSRRLLWLANTSMCRS